MARFEPIDFRVVSDGGSMVGFRPMSERAEAWIDDNLQSMPWQWLGPVLWVDHRIAHTLAAALAAEGFNLKPSGANCL